MPNIIVPKGGDRRVHISDITKEQLAADVNRQAEVIERLREQSQRVARVLLAIALEPESLSFTGKRVTVQRSALDLVKSGMTIMVGEEPDHVSLYAVSEQNIVVAPHIIVPPTNGRH